MWYVVILIIMVQIVVYENNPNQFQIVIPFVLYLSYQGSVFLFALGLQGFLVFIFHNQFKEVTFAIGKIWKKIKSIVYTSIMSKIRKENRLKHRFPK